MRGKRINLTFNPGKEAEKRVLDYISNSGLSNHKAVVTAINGYLDSLNRNKEEDRLLHKVKTLIAAPEKQNGVSSYAGNVTDEAKKAKSLELGADFLSFFDN